MVESIHEMLHAQPFQPFRIVLTSGSQYDVRFPDLVVPLQTQIIYCYPKSDRFALLRLNQIAAVEMLESNAA